MPFSTGTCSAVSSRFVSFLSTDCCIGGSGGICDKCSVLSIVVLGQLGAATGDCKLFGVSPGDVFLLVGLSLIVFLLFGNGGLKSHFLLSVFFVRS